jgi:hypothetical protein
MAGKYLPDGSRAEVAFDELRAWDQPANGGNGDGWISRLDGIAPSLRVWVDINHDGVSQHGELLTLGEARVTRIFFDYAETRRRDQHGNLFRYRSRVGMLNPAGRERFDTIYDVFFYRAD